MSSRDNLQRPALPPKEPSSDRNEGDAELLGDSQIAAAVMRGRLRESVIFSVIGDVLDAQALAKGEELPVPGHHLREAVVLFDASGGLNGPLGRGELIAREVEFSRRTSELILNLERERQARREAEGRVIQAEMDRAETLRAQRREIELAAGEAVAALSLRIQRGALIALGIMLPFAFHNSASFFAALGVSAVGAGFVMAKSRKKLTTDAS